MLDFVVKLIDPKNDYTKIAVFFVIYLLSLWVLFCFWVFLDSQKRFKNVFISVLFFVLVLVLNIPALVFYLIIRPEKDDENVLYLHNESLHEGGVNVPVVNFVGADGVEFSLQIKINKPNNDFKPNMDLKVDWKGDTETLKLVEKSNEDKVIESGDRKESEEAKERKVAKLANKFKNKINNIVSNIKKKDETVEKKEGEEKKVEESKVAPTVAPAINATPTGTKEA